MSVSCVAHTGAENSRPMSGKEARYMSIANGTSPTIEARPMTTVGAAARPELGAMVTVMGDSFEESEGPLTRGVRVVGWTSCTTDGDANPL